MSQYQLPPNDPLFQEQKQTKLSFAEAAYHMKQAWKAMFNHDLTEMQLCIIWSHCAFETAGFSSMKNWNFGNIRKKDKMLYTSYKCHEYLADGSVITYEPYDPKSFFSAWENVQDALKFYLNFLQLDRYKKAFDCLMNENLVGYVRELGNGHYFTAPLEAYTKNVAYWSVIFWKQKNQILNYNPPAPVTEIESLPETQQEDQKMESNITGTQSSSLAVIPSQSTLQIIMNFVFMILNTIKNFFGAKNG